MIPSPSLAAGPHTISAIYSGDDAFAASTADDLPLSIAKAAITVTADNESKAYGAADPTLVYTVSGLLNGDATAVVSGVTLSTATGSAATAGTHSITATGGSAANYTITDISGTLSVSKAPLAITAVAKNKTYGAADPTLTYTATGTLYYGDTAAVVSGVTLSTTTGAAATAGTHTITVTGGTAANYAITDVNGTLTVSPASLTVTADTQSKLYGAPDPPLTFTASGPLFYGDTYSVISGVIAFRANRRSRHGRDSPDHRHRRHGSQLLDHRRRRHLSVSKAHLTVIADDKSKLYGVWYLHSLFTSLGSTTTRPSAW